MMQENRQGDISVLTKLFHHNTWANLRLLDFCESFSGLLADLESLPAEGPIAAEQRHLRALGAQLVTFAYYAATALEFFPKLSNRAFLRPSTAYSLNVAVVRGQKHRVAVSEKNLKNRCKEAFTNPLTDLIVHPGRSHFHAVHDAINFVHY